MMKASTVEMLQCPNSGETMKFYDESLNSSRFSYKKKNHIFSFLDDSLLKTQDKYIQKVYDLFSRVYDLMMPWLFPFLGLTEPGLRKEILNYFDLKPGQKILEVSVGTGANVKLLHNMFPEVDIYGIDISSGMLYKCTKNLKRWHIDIDIFHANASYLPFKDNQFDAVLHCGGINSFAEKERAVLEMLRVVNPGGKIVISDEGLSEKRKKQWYSRVFIGLVFSLFASLEKGQMEPPIEAIPDKGHAEYRLDYIGKGYFWVMHFCKSSVS